MSSRKGGGQVSNISAGGGGVGVGRVNGNLSPKAKNIEGSSSEQGNPKLDQLNRDVTDLCIDPSEDREWEVVGKKSKNRAGAGAKKQQGSIKKFPAPKTRDQSDGLRRHGYSSNGGAGKAGGKFPQANDSRSTAVRGKPVPQSSTRNWEAAYISPATQPPAIPPRMQSVWQGPGRFGSSGTQPKTEENITNVIPGEQPVGGYDSEFNTVAKQPDDDSDEDELVEDSDDDLSDDYDSDVSQKSHETRKKNRWFKAFFDALDRLTVEEINEQSRQWHCPACHNGPGAIDWYKGLQPLMTHAKTKGATRVKLHRELAELLDEELHQRGTSAMPASEIFGKWKGLRDTTTDHEIVWPPMVVITNTVLDKDDNDKWIGMGNQELLEYFSQYAAAKARHSYGPNGHRGMSLLIFEATAMGYLEAERLHKHFAEEGRDKDAWEGRKVLFGPGGQRRLYGYLACKEDINIFNQHSHGKARLRFEMKSYQEMVVIPMKKMSEDNQKLTWLKNKVVKQERRAKTLEASFGVVSQKLRETMEDNRIVRLRTKIQHEENKEEMDYQDQFFKEQIAKVHKHTEEKEGLFEKVLQEQRIQAKQFELNSRTNEDLRLRKEETGRFIESQVKGVEEFEAERDKLISKHREKKAELKAEFRRRYLEEEVELEKEFDATLTKLMEKYAPTTFQASRSSEGN